MRHGILEVPWVWFGYWLINTWAGQVRRGRRCHPRRWSGTSWRRTSGGTTSLSDSSARNHQVTALEHNTEVSFSSVIGVKFAQSSSQWEEKGTIFEEMSQTLLTKKARKPELSTSTKIPFMSSFYGNCVASFPISTFMCLWAIYIFPPSICLFCCRKYVDRSWDYINRSQTHECGNWEWGHAIPIKRIH